MVKSKRKYINKQMLELSYILFIEQQMDYTYQNKTHDDKLSVIVGSAVILNTMEMSNGQQ